MKRKFKYCFYSYVVVSMIFLLTLSITSTKAQEIDFIKSSPKYYWGQGYSDNARIADKQAIENFIDMLSVNIKDRYFQMCKGQNISLVDYTKNVLKTYANTSFKEMGIKSDEQTNSILTLRYIEKENLNQLFYRRETTIKDYFYLAENAEKENRISDALQKYYWALLLLRSHPDNQTMQIKQNESSVLLIEYLPEKINYIFKKLDFNVNNVKYDKTELTQIINLDVLYDSIPAENLQFKFKKNGTWVNTICKNGQGVIEFNNLNNNEKDSILIQVEYNFESEARIDKELTEIFENLRIPPFESSEYVIKIPAKYIKTNPVEEFNPNIEIVNIRSDEDYPEEINTIISLIIKNIETRSLNTVKSYFSASGWDDISHLINYGNAKLISQNFNLKVLKINNEYVIREVPMYFKFNKNNKEFVENLVFYLNDSLLVTGISFSISKVAINDILNQKEEWGTTQDKYQLIHFIENYKTAYCFKRLDYIEKVFDDNALIIVGKRLEDAPVAMDKNNIQLYNNNQIEYIQKSKSSYLASLSMVFKSNEYINIHFEDNLVKKRGGDDKTYGIQIAQYYTSEHYSDKGYLFLMIDLNDSLNPIIYVRTWQPQKNVDGSIIGLQDFHY